MFSKLVTNSAYPKERMIARFRLVPLTDSIRKVIALGGLAFASSSVWANTQINPNEIWLDFGVSDGTCALDIDLDGDVDLFRIHSEVVTMLKNTGTPESPEYALPQIFLNDSGALTLIRSGLSDCRYSFNNRPSLIDIDNDGDLDLFKTSSGKFMEYFRNDGTSEHPVFVGESKKQFGISSTLGYFMFRDIDNDGDEDLFDTLPPLDFYENTGTPEQAFFTGGKKLQFQQPCGLESDDETGFLIDLNNDSQWDMLCNNFEYFEFSKTGFLPGKKFNVVDENSLTLLENISNIQAIDLDKDGDMDFLGLSSPYVVLLNNVSDGIIPRFEPVQTFGVVAAATSNIFMADLDADNDLDYVFESVDKTIEYAMNSDSNIMPQYDISEISPALQCNNSFDEIIDSFILAPNTGDSYYFQNITLVDIDGDKGFDLFSQLNLSDSSVSNISVYCENQGSVTNPLFISGVVNAFGLDPEKAKTDASDQDIFFGDVDGDGDQDAWIGSTFYHNIGNSSQPLFRQSSHIPFHATSHLDMDGDGQIDSAIDKSKGLRLLFNALEPAINISATSINDDLVLATNRVSQTQLQLCKFIENTCATNVRPTIAKELSLGTGDFDGNGVEDIILAMIDENGLLKIEIFNSDLQLIGSGSGGTADTVSVSAGQLDDDAEDEYVVSIVQSDGRVAAISFNLDGSRLGKAVANHGKNPSVDVGKFENKKDAYVLAYLTLDNRLETATFRGNGSLIGQGLGGQANHITVKAADILQSTAEDEYVISLIQSDGTLGLIAFASDGTRLGKAEAGSTQQPELVSGFFPEKQDSGIAVSLIQADKKPTVIFYDNQGKRLGKGAGSVLASVSTLTLIDVDDNGVDEAVLVYIDEAGIPHWETFAADGKKM